MRIEQLMSNIYVDEKVYNIKYSTWTSGEKFYSEDALKILNSCLYNNKTSKLFRHNCISVNVNLHCTPNDRPGERKNQHVNLDKVQSFMIIMKTPNALTLKRSQLKLLYYIHNKILVVSKPANNVAVRKKMSSFDSITAREIKLK